MARKVCTWVLVADGAKAKIYENGGPGEGLTEIYSRGQAADHTRDIVSDRQGRHEQHGAAHHAMDPHTDPQRHREHEFARSICTHLDEKAAAASFDRIVVAAAPRTLGDIRDMLGKQVRDRVHAELDKDLVHLPVGDLVRHLSDVVSL